VTGPFSDEDMARWSALDLDDRGLYDAALWEMQATGFDAGVAAMPLELLDPAVLAFCRAHGESRAARVIAAAWITVWRRAHPEADWVVHTHGGEG
jgi:hypothetical protein